MKVLLAQSLTNRAKPSLASKQVTVRGSVDRENIGRNQYGERILASKTLFIIGVESLTLGEDSNEILDMVRVWIPIGV